MPPDVHPGDIGPYIYPWTSQLLNRICPLGRFGENVKKKKILKTNNLKPFFIIVCNFSNKVFDQKSPFHNVLESRGGHPSIALQMETQPQVD